MSQYEMILDYIDRFGSISPMEAFMDLGITKLSTRISERCGKPGMNLARLWSPVRTASARSVTT